MASSKYHGDVGVPECLKRRTLLNVFREYPEWRRGRRPQGMFAAQPPPPGKADVKTPGNSRSVRQRRHLRLPAAGKAEKTVISL